MSTYISRPAEKEPPPRPPLITPSASPPVSRVDQRKDRPPAAKRPRLSPTPSSSSSIRAGSSTSNSIDFDVQWLQSRDRLLKTWDQLAERYYKPLDEDDIVDLRDLKILKDRGVTRGAVRNYTIGSFVAPKDADAATATSQGADEDEDGGEDGGEDDESADELDILSDAPVPSVPDNYKTWYVPPADHNNPEDIEAFREFEEAERQLRELNGKDDEETDADREQGLAAPGEDDDAGSEVREEEVLPVPKPKPKPQQRKSRPPSRPPEDDSSEDELAAWVIDYSPIPPRRSTPPDDIIDLTRSRSPSPKPASRGRLRSCAPAKTRTAHSRARSKSKASVTEAKRPRSLESPPARLASPMEVSQLLTPPRSSSAVDIVPSVEGEELDLPPPPRPAETPSPKFPKPRQRYTPRPRIPSDDEEDLSSTHDAILPPPEPFRVGPPKKAKKRPSLTGLRPEVVITVSRKKLNGIAVNARPSTPEPPAPPSVAASTPKNGKGKQKEIPAPIPAPESMPPIAPASRRRRSQSQPRVSSRDSDSPPPALPSSRGTKRRRVSSLSSLSDNSPAKVATPEPIPDARKRNFMRSGMSGYSSDVPPPSSSSPTPHSDDDYEPEDRRLVPSRARMGSPAPQIPPFPYPPVFPSYTQQHHDGFSASGHRRPAEDRHTPYPPALQDPHAQYMFAQAWHFWNLMASGALPTSGYRPDISFPPAPWPPYTPSHQRHPTHPIHGLNTPSSEAGPSRSVYSTPTHQSHPHPYAYDPGFSNGTLPPSSPMTSSPATSSPPLRPASVPPGQRSRSRGRRVSFKLDGNDRPLPPTPPRRHAILESEHALASGSHYASAKTSKGKWKGKARAEPQEEDRSRESDDEPPPAPPRGRASQRARTPGPPSQRDKSVPSTSSKGSAKTPKSKRK